MPLPVIVERTPEQNLARLRVEAQCALLVGQEDLHKELTRQAEWLAKCLRKTSPITEIRRNYDHR